MIIQRYRNTIIWDAVVNTRIVKAKLCCAEKNHDQYPQARHVMTCAND